MNIELNNEELANLVYLIRGAVYRREEKLEKLKNRFHITHETGFDKQLATWKALAEKMKLAEIASRVE